MKANSFYLILFAAILLFSCSSSKNSTSTPEPEINTYWVSGFKPIAAAGAGKSNVLYVSKKPILKGGEWEYFYSNIEGFEWKEGFIQEIIVKEEKKTNVPADASSIKYTLVEEVGKIPDNRSAMKGGWILSQFNGNPLNRMVKAPTMLVDLQTLQVSGTSGCNNYTGKMANFTPLKVEMGPAAMTQKVCGKNTIEQLYFGALQDVASYKVKDDKLMLFDGDDKNLLTFLKEKASNAIDGNWLVTAINESLLNQNEALPQFTIDLDQRKIFGNNSCNYFSGEITRATDVAIDFKPLAVTNRMCQEMGTADAFNKAMSNVSSYDLDNKNMFLTDSKGNKLVTLIRAGGEERLTGSWIAKKLVDYDVNRMTTTPVLNIDVEEMTVSGFNSCDYFTGVIPNVLTESFISFGPFSKTAMDCNSTDAANHFNSAMTHISYYTINGDELTFYDREGKESATFVKAGPNVALNGSWTAVKIDGGPINRMAKAPLLELHLQDMKVSGNDGCNTIAGDIEILNSVGINFGKLVKTNKACNNSDLANPYNNALNQVHFYNATADKLSLFDEDGNEVLTFLKK